MKTITQEQMDNIKSKPVNEQVLFLLDLIDKGQEVLEVNKEIIEKNLQQVFVLTVMEIVTASMVTALDAINNPEILNVTDEQGKEYITITSVIPNVEIKIKKNTIVSNVVNQMSA